MSSLFVLFAIHVNCQAVTKNNVLAIRHNARHTLKIGTERIKASKKELRPAKTNSFCGDMVR